jgi:TPR repeat protein
LDGQDFKGAETLYISAAVGGSGLAQSRLAFLRKYGRPGVKIDRVEAEQWIKKVQEKGSSAIEWLRSAADRENHPAGLLELGLGCSIGD